MTSPKSDVTTPPTFEVTPLPDGGFRFIGAAVLDQPIGAVWAKVHNIEQFVAIVLQGIASNFQWVEGGSPGVVPARFTFEASGGAPLEEVYYRSNEEHVLKYRLVTPALGMESYLASIELTSQSPTSTRAVYTRDMRFADPSLVDSFSGLLRLEMENFQAHFAKS